MPLVLRRFVAALLLVSLSTLSLFAQQTKPNPEEQQRLTLLRLFDSRNLEPGEYQIQVRIRDHISGETITPSATFTVVP